MSYQITIVPMNEQYAAELHCKEPIVVIFKLSIIQLWTLNCGENYSRSKFVIEMFSVSDPLTILFLLSSNSFFFLYLLNKMFRRWTSQKT